MSSMSPDVIAKSKKSTKFSREELLISSRKKAHL
jgi:hypothetical protein